MTATRARRPYRHFSSDEVGEMCRLYVDEGLSLEKIGDRFVCDLQAVRYHLKKRGIERRKPWAYDRPVGPEHRWWKGGETKDRKGYILLYKPGYPGVGKSKQLPLHRYIAEMYLRENHPGHPALLPGRGLSRDWVVHHKNKQKADNRPENLEVMPRKHHTPTFHLQMEIDRLRGILNEHGIPH